MVILPRAERLFLSQVEGMKVLVEGMEILVEGMEILVVGCSRTLYTEMRKKKASYCFPLTLLCPSTFQ